MRHRAKKKKLSGTDKIERSLIKDIRRGSTWAKEVFLAIARLKNQNWRIEF